MALLRAAARRSLRFDRPSAVRRGSSSTVRDQLAHLRAIRYEIPDCAFQHRWSVAVKNRRLLRLDVHTEMQRFTAR